MKAALAASSASAVTAIAGTWDMHACAAPGPVPHGPGLVTKGSATVFINGLPATPSGVMVFEAAGGPADLSAGSPDVLIDDGGGGGGSSAQTGAEAKQGETQPSPDGGSPDGGSPDAGSADAGSDSSGSGADSTAPAPSAPPTITSETVFTKPANRARTRVAVGEKVKLTASPGPATWAITSGSGKLKPAS